MTHFYIPRAMTRDEDKYPDAESFNPAHFLDGEGKLNTDDLALIFGFGRRSVSPHAIVKSFIE